MMFLNNILTARRWLTHVTRIVVMLTAISLLTTCRTSRKTTRLEADRVPIAWAELILDIILHTPANSPTYTSRSLGYIGVTMYESVVHGYPDHNSLAMRLNGLGSLPAPVEGEEYEWILSLNAAQAFMVRHLYNQTSDENKARIDSLENAIEAMFSKGVEQALADRSVMYGRAVAEAIFEWSKTDGGHRGYLRNFDKSMVFPNKPGSWEPPLYAQSFSHYPLHPHWGDNRTFVKENSELPLPEMIKYDTTPRSEYYQQFIKVYEKNKTLTLREKETALWWNDDPGETFSPPGHSFYLATQVLGRTSADVIRSTETYARVGIAVADAFITCWKWKYHFFSERPSGYITKHIDKEWESFWPDPPFPAFPSGHATQAAATATVLTDLFGEEFVLTDSTHARRPIDELRHVGYKARSFATFWQVAEETANSRFFGGIHTPQDNEVGLAEGRNIGENVNQLNWIKTGTYAIQGQ